MLSKTEFSNLVKVSLGKLTQSKCLFLINILRIKAINLLLSYTLLEKTFLFILENLKLIKKSYDNISKILVIPYHTPNFVKNPQQRSLFLLFLKDFQSSKSCMIKFGIGFPEICFEKIINFELSSQIYIKIKELDCLLKNQQFLIEFIQKI